MLRNNFIHFFCIDFQLHIKNILINQTDKQHLHILYLQNHKRRQLHLFDSSQIKHKLNYLNTLYHHSYQQIMPPRHQVSSSSSSDAQSSSSQQINFTTVIVSNLTPSINQNHLKQIFSNFGQIQSLGIRDALNKQNILQKRHAMINFINQKDAQTAVQYMDDGWLDGLKIKVKLDSNNGQKLQQIQASSTYKKQAPARSSEPTSQLKIQQQHNADKQLKNQHLQDSISEIQPKRKQKSSRHSKNGNQSRSRPSRKQEKQKHHNNSSNSGARHGNNSRRYDDRSRDRNRSQRDNKQERQRKDRNRKQYAGNGNRSDKHDRNKRRRQSSDSDSDRRRSSRDSSSNRSRSKNKRRAQSSSSSSSSS